MASPRVQADIHQYLFHLRRFRLHWLQVPRDDLDFDVFANHLVQKTHQVLDNMVQLDGSWL
jgi:hypothetical protein